MSWMFMQTESRSTYFVGARVFGAMIYQWLKRHLRPKSRRREMARRRRTMEGMTKLTRRAR